MNKNGVYDLDYAHNGFDDDSDGNDSKDDNGGEVSDQDLVKIPKERINSNKAVSLALSENEEGKRSSRNHSRRSKEIFNLNPEVIEDESARLNLEEFPH